MNVSQFTERAKSLMNQRGVPTNTQVGKRFVEDFIAHGWYQHSVHGGGDHILSVLGDEAQLSDGEVFNTNHVGNLRDLFPAALQESVPFCNLVQTLAANNGKGVGVGEQIFPLLVRDWSYSTVGDGDCGGIREIKKDSGSSIQPHPVNTTDRNKIDELNKTFWNGTNGGQINSHKKHAQVVNGNKQAYTEYLSEIYVLDKDRIPDLVDKLFLDFDNVQHFQRVLGLFVLEVYMNRNNIKSLILINPETLDYVNIVEVNDTIHELGVEFEPIMKRGKNGENRASGYAVIKRAKTTKPRSRKPEAKDAFAKIMESAPNKDNELAIGRHCKQEFMRLFGVNEATAGSWWREFKKTLD